MSSTERLKTEIERLNEETYAKAKSFVPFALKINLNDEIEVFYPREQEAVAASMEIIEHFFGLVSNHSITAAAYSVPSKSSGKQWSIHMFVEVSGSNPSTEIFMLRKKFFGGWERTPLLSHAGDKPVVFCHYEPDA